MVSVEEMEHWAPQISCLRPKPSFSLTFSLTFSDGEQRGRGTLEALLLDAAGAVPAGTQPAMACPPTPHVLDVSAGRDERLCEAIAAQQCDLKDATPL